MEAIESFIGFTMFGSAAWFAAFVIVLIGLVIISEIQEDGVIAFVSVVIFMGFNYFKGSLNISDYISWYDVGLYLGVGFVFSVVRTFFKGKELDGEYEVYKADQLKSIEKGGPNHYNKVEEKSKWKLDKFNLKEHVFRWWFMFPVCMISWFFGSILKDIWNFVYSKFESLYLKAFNV